MAECMETESAACPVDDNTAAEYFRSYEDLDVHELMLKDVPRTRAYERFIAENTALFQGRVVVDVGAGTGILSLFAARAGAKQVYAIEASGLADLCETIVADNGLQDKITVLKGRAEDVTLPDGVEAADILISEWMGFYLLHESMLDSVLAARDRLLKPEGIMLPSAASLYICPVTMQQFHKDKFDFWSNVYGFDFSSVTPHMKNKTLREPQVVSLDPAACLSAPELVANIDLRFAEPGDVKKILGRFNFRVQKNGVLHGFACWFDVEFEGPSSVTLSTSPEAHETHWKQTVVMLPDALLVSKGEEVQCNVCLAQAVGNSRRYDICIEVPDEDSEDDENNQQTASERLVAALGSQTNSSGFNNMQ